MAKPNIIVLCNDEEQHFDLVLNLVPERLRSDFLQRLKARNWLREHGVSFDNFHGTSIPCTSARSVMWTGHHAPDTQLVDNMELPYQISLGRFDPKASGTLGTEYGVPTLGHLLQAQGYYPSFQGKVHLAQDVQLDTTEEMAERYGFFDWSGTTPGAQVRDLEGTGMGHLLDPVIAEKAVNWLHDVAPGLKKPWALLVNFINPHDTMLVDIDGRGKIQQMQSKKFPIAASPYHDWWEPQAPPNFAPEFGVQDQGPRPQTTDLWASLCSTLFDNIPFDATCEVSLGLLRRKTVPMWQAFLNHYLNCIIDNDSQMWKVIRAFLLEPGLVKARTNTMLVWMADHGDMMMSHGGVSSYYQEGKGEDDGQTAHEVWMPLRQKGPFIYRENYRLPFVVASLSRELVPEPGSRTPALANHTDLVPTLLGWAAGKDCHAWYGQTYGGYLQRLSPPVKGALTGKDLSPIVKAPSQYRSAQWGERKALLFTYDSFNSVDPEMVLAFVEERATPPVHFENRACMRGFFDGRYKFARVFSPRNYSTQANASGSYASLTTPTRNADGKNNYYGQDLVLFDTLTDPAELVNRIEQAGCHGLPTLDQLNQQLNQLMQAELTDPARVPLTLQYAMAGLPWVFSFSPDSGVPGSTEVTIGGAGLNDRPEVYFGKVRSLNVRQNDDGSLSACVPLGAVTAPITVRTSIGQHTSVADFTVDIED